MTTVRHSRVGRKIRMPDAGQLPPLGLGRTLPDRGGGVRIPAYPPRNIADPARHEADFLYCHQRAGISLSRNGDTRNTRQKLPACRRPVLTPHGPDATEPGRLGQNVRAPRFCVLFCPSPNDNYFTFTLF